MWTGTFFKEGVKFLISIILGGSDYGIYDKIVDILGEGAGWSSFTVRERGEKGTHVRDPRNMTLKHV